MEKVPGSDMTVDGGGDWNELGSEDGKLREGELRPDGAGLCCRSDTDLAYALIESEGENCADLQQ
ncbi:MAG: hypothetical protein U5K71_04275 [Gracilimonas sp.]|nr:hypothetical protein [Gracilimonas sp.]